MSIETSINNLHSPEDLQRLLVEEIGFEPEERAVFFEDESGLQAAYRRPVVIAGLHGFAVLALPVATPEGMLKTRQRQAVEALRARYPFALFIFADASLDNWHWVFSKPAPGAGKRALRRMEIGNDPRLHTIAERLELLRNKLPACANQGAVAALVEEAFDVEAISKTFFREYQEQYKKFKARIVADNRGKPWIDDDNKLARYVQLLLGRIMFLHFIEKKQWLDGNPDFIRTLFEPYRRSEKSGFHQAVLEPLFFTALGKEGRSKVIAGAEYKIPFLNGGLFEVRTEFAEADPLYGPLVADELFVGLFGMLGRYNFTVDESTPLDQTVGIDPEMLGKVFENLLEAEARHASGTYYTPRSIVGYMCRETLYRHLAAHTGISRETVNHLFDCALEGRKPEIETALAQRLEAVLDRVTVLDLAVGSGAFLLGMLQEILALKESLARARGDSEERIMAERARRKAAIIHESLYAVDISFPAIEIARLRLWLALVVDEAEPHPLPNLDYHILRGDTLKTLLDGKPVLPPRSSPATGLAPSGQALLPMPGVQMTLDETATNQHTEALLRHLDNLYAANGEEKSRLRQEIRAELTAMIETHWAMKEAELKAGIAEQEKKQHQGKLVFKGKELKLYQQAHSQLEEIGRQRGKLNESRSKGEELELPFTPLHLYFAEVFSGDNPGFDIIIANPPYVRHEEIKAIKPQLAAEFPDFYCGTADLYTYFYKRGLELLKSGGHLCFIAPNKFMRAGYGENTRKLLTGEATPRVIIDFGELPVFDAGTDPAIVLVEKTAPENLAGQGIREITVAIIKEASDIERVSEVISERGFTMQPQDLRAEGWTLESPAVLSLMTKLRTVGTPLGEYVQGRFYRGILTGFNDAFVIDATTRERLIAADSNSAELIKPWLRGRDIRKWKMEWAGLYVIFTRRGTDIERYPAIKRHLEQFREDLEPKKNASQQRGRKPGTYHWFEIQDNIAYFAEFDQPKIVYADIAKLLRASYDTSGAFCGNTLYILPTNDLSLLAILHSRLFDWYARQEFQSLGDPWHGGRLRFIAQFMEKFPIASTTPEQKSPITQRVQTILADPSSPDMPRLEAEIDELVFDLYGLTADERRLVLASREYAQNGDGEKTDDELIEGDGL